MNDHSHHTYHSHGIRKDSYFTDRKGPQVGETKHGAHARSVSNAEYYDLVEQGMDTGSGAVNYHYAPHSKSNAPNGALPAHPAYLPRVVSRLSQTASPTPPRNVHKTATADSYALQAYLDASRDQSVDPAKVAETAANSTPSSQPASRQPSPARQAVTSAAQLVPQVVKPKPLAFGLSSLSKLMIPKKHTPPQLNLLEATPVSAYEERPTHNLRISRPLAVLDPRFQDKPLGGGQILADEAPASFTDEYLKRREDNKSPLLSGNSRVYG